ncbi:MAG: CHAT domain-containing protein [Kofleriaceae bacterium]
MAEHPELEQIHALADGELDGDARERAEEHLADCEICQAELADLMQMAALPKPAAAAPAKVISLEWYRRRSIQVVGVVLAAAAAVTAIYLRPKPSTPVVAPTKLALADKRPIEARLSWQGTADYRAYSVQRGSTLAKEPISLSAMADLEKAGDNHGVAALAVLGGDYEQAKKYIQLAGTSADVLADHAALELQLGQPAMALAFADAALEKSPDMTVAMWNRGLAARDLGLRHVAADSFRDVAKTAESGWAAEATQRADALEKDFVEELALNQRVIAATQTLAKTQEGLSLDDAKRLPGMARIALYDALRAAPTAEAIAKLKPLADAIDQATGDTSTLAAVNRAKPDPIAAKAYLALLTDPNPNAAKILSTLRQQKANDALVVAMLKVSSSWPNVEEKDLPELSKLADASEDPWIQMIGVEQRGANAIEHQDYPKAEAALSVGREKCKVGAPTFRCMKVMMRLAQTYRESLRLPEAQVAVADAWRRARELQSLDQDIILSELIFVTIMSDDTFGRGLPLVRAYVAEVAARMTVEQQQGSRANACEQISLVHETLANAMINQLRFEEAATVIAPKACPIAGDAHVSSSRVGLFVRAELVYTNGGDVAALRKDIAENRASKLAPGERALLDHTEGRALIHADRAAGVALLETAITEGTAASHADNAELAVGMSYAVLAIDAAKHDEGDNALAILGRELRVEPRKTCVLGIVLDDRDVAVVARGTDGKSTIAMVQRKTLAIDASTVVPDTIVSRLKSCPDVDVLARPPFHGVSRLLPDDIAWRYESFRSQPVGTSVGGSIVVANVQPPASLGLPALAPWRDGTPTLSGPAATPSRVLAAMGSASDVVIDAHGIGDSGDAAYIALSPESDGQFALTAANVSRSKLESHPVVILAACEAAKAAPVFRARWSLPAAFVSAGARAVVAPTTAIPDDTAGKFFDELRTRAKNGASLATVVRDLRKEWSSDPNATWVRDVVVFE